MNNVPEWWLVASALFFVVNIVVWVILGITVLKLWKVIEETKPKVDELAVRGKEVAQRVEQVANKVDHLADTLQSTVDHLGGRARGVVGSAELVAGAATQSIDKITPVIAAVVTGFKILRAVQEFRGRKAKQSKNKGSLLDFVRRK